MSELSETDLISCDTCNQLFVVDGCAAAPTTCGDCISKEVLAMTANQNKELPNLWASKKDEYGMRGRLCSYTPDEHFTRLYIPADKIRALIEHPAHLFHSHNGLQFLLEQLSQLIEPGEVKDE